jgi:hypothetical protein
MQTTSRRLSSAEVDKLSLGRGAQAAECRIGLRDGTNSKRVARADAEYRADMQAGVTLGLVWHPLIATNAHQVLADPRLTAPGKAVAGAVAGLSPSAAANTDNTTKPGAAAIAHEEKPAGLAVALSLSSWRVPRPDLPHQRGGEARQLRRRTPAFRRRPDACVQRKALARAREPSPLLRRHRNRLDLNDQRSGRAFALRHQGAPRVT